MKYPTPPNEMDLARLYFYNLIQNPRSLPPQGLDALTAEIIRRLVLEEQLAEVKAAYQLDPARERVWHNFLAETDQPTSVWPPVGPALAPSGRYAPAGRPEPQPLYGWRSQPTRRKSVFERIPLIVIIGVVGAVLLLGLAFQVMFGVSLPNNETSEAFPISSGQSIAIPGEKPRPPGPKFPGNIPPTIEPVKAIAVINLKELISPAIDDLAVAFEIEPAELQDRMKSGLSLQSLAKTLNSSPDLVRNVLIESFDRQLNEGLQAGKWSAAQVEQALNETPKFVDQILNNGKY